MHLSIVTPAYKCDECIYELHKRLVNTLSLMGISDYEIIFVNDGSPNCDWDIIFNLCKVDRRVKGINLSRNFGQHKAITAGLDYAKGDRVVVMDCDLQDQPEELPKLYDKLEDGFDVVFARRINRKDPTLKVCFSRLYKKIYNLLVEVYLDDTIGNYCIMRKPVLKGILSMRENIRTHTLLILWLGFDIAYIDVNHGPRFKGKSAYNFYSYLSHVIEIILYRSNIPLKIVVTLGSILSSLSFLYGLFLALNQLMFGRGVTGWTSIMVSLYFITGLLLSTLGVLGLYVGMIFDEVKGRPLYYVKDWVNFES